LKKLDDIVKKKTGFIPQHTVLNVLPNKAWMNFLTKNDFEKEANGIYLPKENIAYVPKKATLPTKAHEYYGHGNFCENSTIGQKLVKAIKTDDVEKINSVYEETFFLNESFAVWIEQFISNELKMGSVIKDCFSEHLLSFAKEQETVNDYFFKKSFGFPATPTTVDAKEILTKLYGAKNIDMAVLYGSKKPNSDLDFFVVSDTIRSEHDSWLDVYSVSNKEFEEGTHNLLINITDPLFSGEVIIGHKKFYEAKNQVINQPITTNSIYANYHSYEKEKSILDRLTGRDLKVSQSYVDTFLRNALALSKGLKLLTKNEVYENVRKYS